MATIVDPASDFTALPVVPEGVFTAPLQRPPGIGEDWLEPRQREYSSDDDAIWNALSTPLADESAMPLARDDEGDRKALRRLQDAVAERSRELALPDGVLASRRWLQALLEQQQWPPMLAGWRRAQLEGVLAPLLAETAANATA